MGIVWGSCVNHEGIVWESCGDRVWIMKGLCGIEWGSCVDRVGIVWVSCVDHEGIVWESCGARVGSSRDRVEIMRESCVDRVFFIDNIRAEFPLLEANLPCYSFLSMDSIMSICTTTLYNFDRVTDPEPLKKIISAMNKTTCSSDPFPARLLMSHLHAIIPIIHHIENLCLTTGIFYFL